MLQEQKPTENQFCSLAAARTPTGKVNQNLFFSLGKQYCGSRVYYQTLVIFKLDWVSSNIIYKNILYLNQVKLKFFNKPIGSHTPIRRYTQQFSPYRLRWRYQPYPPKFDTSNVCPSTKSSSTYLKYYHLCEPFRVVTISNLTHHESNGISHQCVSISNEK